MRVPRVDPSVPEVGHMLPHAFGLILMEPNLGIRGHGAGSITPKNHRLAAESSLAHPVRQGGIEVIGMAWKPLREFVSEPAAIRDVALIEQGLNRPNRFENCLVLVDMAFPRRKAGFEHPSIFLFEVARAMRRQRFQSLDKRLVWCRLEVREMADEFLMN